MLTLKRLNHCLGLDVGPWEGRAKERDVPAPTWGQQGRARDTWSSGEPFERAWTICSTDAEFLAGITGSHGHPPSSIRSSTVGLQAAEGQFHVALWSVREVGRRKRSSVGFARWQRKLGRKGWPESKSQVQRICSYLSSQSSILVFKTFTECLICFSQQLYNWSNVLSLLWRLGCLLLRECQK